MKHLMKLLALALLAGCAVAPVGLTDSSTPLMGVDGQSRRYQILGKAHGSQGFVSLLGILPFGEPDIKSAIDDAVRKLNGDAMINPRYWYRAYYVFLFSYQTVEVEGDVIKFLK